MRHALLPDDLYQHPFPSLLIEIPVVDLLPRPEVEPPLGDRHHYLSSHDLPLDVRVGVILACFIVPVLAHRLMRGQLLEPAVIINPRAVPLSRR